jgi:hypothetical protein
MGLLGLLGPIETIEIQIPVPRKPRAVVSVVSSKPRTLPSTFQVTETVKFILSHPNWINRNPEFSLDPDSFHEMAKAVAINFVDLESFLADELRYAFNEPNSQSVNHSVDFSTASVMVRKLGAQLAQNQ